MFWNDKEFEKAWSNDIDSDETLSNGRVTNLHWPLLNILSGNSSDPHRKKNTGVWRRRYKRLRGWRVGTDGQGTVGVEGASIYQQLMDIA